MQVHEEDPSWTVLDVVGQVSGAQCREEAGSLTIDHCSQARDVCTGDAMRWLFERVRELARGYRELVERA